MKTFHLHPETGEPGECRATKGQCPFGSAEAHYETLSEAREAYETLQGSGLPPVSRSSMKIMDAPALKRALYRESHFAGPSLLVLQAAATFAEELHEGQTRSGAIQGRVNTPYVEHPLRNALRLVRMGVRDQDLLTASLLHDTVEDCSARFVELYLPGKNFSPVEAREALANHIRKNFGERTYRLVLGVTNPYQSSKERRAMSQEEKHSAYQKQVKAEIDSSPTILLVKLMDYMDNAGSLHHSLEDELPRARRQADKYLPLAQSFCDSIDKHGDVLERDQGMGSETREALKAKLKMTEKRLEALINTR